MSKPEAVVDHVVINVADRLDEAQNLFQRLGFALTPRGHHSLGSSNHLAIFGENYLELLGYEPGNEKKRRDLWLVPLGLSGLVWKTRDSDAIYHHLTEQKVAGDPPAEFFRPVDLGNGEQPEARFRTVRLDAHQVPNGRSFFCHHLTPELVWREEWQRHPNGVADIISFVIGAANPQKAAWVYGQVFGSQALESDGNGGVTLAAGRAQVHFITPKQATERFGAVEQGREGSARMVALGFASRSLDAVRRSLLQGNIQFHENEQQGTIQVNAADAFGVALTFYPD